MNGIIEDMSYSSLKKRLEIYEALYDLPDEAKAPALFFLFYYFFKFILQSCRKYKLEC